MSSPVQQSVWRRAPLNWLVSLRFGIVLLALLVVASVIGTLIAPLSRALELVYHSWWYGALLLLLGANIGCTAVRTTFLRIVPQMRPRFQRNKAFYSSVEPHSTVRYEGDADFAASAFRKRGFRVDVDETFGHARKGRLSRWGAPIAHLGVVAVLLGGFASAWVAEEMSVTLAEGEQTDRSDPPDRAPLGFVLRCEEFDTGYFPDTYIPSHFTSTLTVLEAGKAERTDYVEVNHSMKAAGWILHQTSYREIDNVKRYRLQIDHPSLASPESIELSPGQTRFLSGSKDVAVSLGADFPLVWSVSAPNQPAGEGRLAGTEINLRLRVERFEPDFVIGPGGEIVSRGKELNNPAVLVGLYEGDRLVSHQWLFEREELKKLMHGESGPLELDLAAIHSDGEHRCFEIAVRDTKTQAPLGTFDLELGGSAKIGSPDGEDEPPADELDSGDWGVVLAETVPAFTTTITLTRNPAIPPIYAGCAIMVLGLCVAFFVRRKDVWFMIDTEKKSFVAAAIYPQPRDRFDPATAAALEAIRISGAAHANAEGDSN